MAFGKLTLKHSFGLMPKHVVLICCCTEAGLYFRKGFEGSEMGLITRVVTGDRK